MSAEPHSSSDAARFFDRTSATYRAKYGTESPFHHYYFNERLDKATAGLDLAGCTVLDIGSGTGNLYEHLAPRSPGMRFLASDVSAGMLAQSPVPAEDRFVGHAYEIAFPVQAFDAVFMLGVTTYLSPEELARNLAFIGNALKPGGHAVITFTHARGLDTWSRRLAKLPLRLMGRRDKVLSSGLRTYTYSVADATRIVGAHLRIDRCSFHNHTIFPFNLLVPHASIRLAERIDRLPANHWLHRWLSSDLVLHCSKP